MTEKISLKKLKELDLGHDFVVEAIAIYIKEIPQYLKLAEECFDQEKRDDLKRNIHTLKSHSTLLDMVETNKKLKYWENEVLTQPLSEFEVDFNHIKDSFVKAVEELKILQQEGSF